MSIQNNKYSFLPISEHDKQLLKGILIEPHINFSNEETNNDPVVDLNIWAIHNETGDTVAVAGLNYLEDVQLFEAFLYSLSDSDNFSESTEILGLVIDEAFNNLGIDKLCARAIDGSHMDATLKSFGFCCLGERIFKDDKNTIWNYYELENDIIDEYDDSFSHTTDSDWDNIF
ncbi:MAG: hypothetical protein H6551_13145 [Chitinophagales bacterium]|nr:hypothetical protein [Chitinophagaceae bacterium]MCB9066078.1 hypothetical protein [Chitinophagales bacterium]